MKLYQQYGGSPWAADGALDLVATQSLAPDWPVDLVPASASPMARATGPLPLATTRKQPTPSQLWSDLQCPNARISRAPGVGAGEELGRSPALVRCGPRRTVTVQVDFA